MMSDELEVTPPRKRGRRDLDPQIVKLHLEGHTGPTIAKLLGCSRQNVRQVLARKGFAGKEGWNRHIAKLSVEHAAFLEREAARHHVGLPEIVAAILRDAIDELIDEEAELVCLGDNTGALRKAPIQAGSRPTRKTSLV